MRKAQRLLAAEVTEMIHGSKLLTTTRCQASALTHPAEDGVRKAVTATCVLYGNDFASVKAADVVDALDGLPVLHILDADEAFGNPVPKLAVRCGIATSNSTSPR